MLLPQERIPWILRRLAFRRDVLFRVPPTPPATSEHSVLRLKTEDLRLPPPAVYLTFDDGPIPESTPWLLETLREHGAKATFFMVADNARRYPDLFEAVIAEGHAIGNHTYHHRPPYRQTVEELLADVRQAAETLWEGGFLTAPASAKDCVAMEGRFATAPSRPGARLFRPPHGLITRSQQKALQKEGYRIVMFDLNTLDYRKDRTPEGILESVKKNVRPGCIINLHDSLKSIAKLKQCLPAILAFLQENGYAMEALPSR